MTVEHQDNTADPGEQVAGEFRPKNVLFLIDMVTASSWYRCNTPGAALAKRGHDVWIKDRFNQHDLKWCDVLVVQRLWQPTVLEAIREMNQAGKLTVFDVDDDYWSLHTSNPAYQSWQQPGALNALASVIKSCQIVTVTTAALAARLKQFNPNIRVIPNSLPGQLWPDAPKDVGHDGPLVVGWAGGSSHYIDLREVSAIFPQILERYPQVEVRLIGANPAWFSPDAGVTFVEAVPIEEYPALLGGFDIGLAPLEDTRFNASKSDLKIIEYSMVGLPIIASKVSTYSRSIRPGESGFLAKNSKDWLKHLRMLIEQPEVRVSMGAEARKWAESRVIAKNVDLWLDAYHLDH